MNQKIAEPGVAQVTACLCGMMNSQCFEGACWNGYLPTGKNCTVTPAGNWKYRVLRYFDTIWKAMLCPQAGQSSSSPPLGSPWSRV
jgi:hypothetical protein